MEEPLLFDRSLTDVSTMVGHAKLVETDLLPVSQVISFTSNLMGGDMKLLEVTSEVADGLEAGEVLTMRGEAGDNSVLCSKTKTFEIKEAETSNSLLLLPELSFPDQISGSESRKLSWANVNGVFHKYLELVEIRPKLRKLKEMLSETPFTEESKKDGQIGPTFEKLLDKVQASEEEIREGLNEFECIKVDGMWFILDQDYQMKILSYILRFFDENSWRFDCVMKAETVGAISELVPPEIVDQVFSFYCKPMVGGSADEFCLDEDKVCRFYGDFLLAANTAYLLPEFLEMWQNAVPDGITTDLRQLDGLVLVEDKDPPVIKRFAESSLPLGIAERLSVLFTARERWTLDEISPFVTALTTNKLNVNALLTKHARALNVGGKKYFCAKHGK